MKAGTSSGRIPEKVLVSERARVTAGFANDVDAVNQYAAVMYAPTANGVAEERVRATAPDHGDQAERGDELAERLRSAGADFGGRRVRPVRRT